MSAAFQHVAVYVTPIPERGEAALTVVCELAAEVDTPVRVHTEVTQSGLPALTIEDPVTVFRGDTSVVQSGVVVRAQLWQPHGYGRQPLYDARVTLLGEDDQPLDERTLRFGVREVEWLEGSRLRVNGRELPLRGVGWEPLGEGAPFERLLLLAREARLHLFYVLTGARTEAVRFYDLCDVEGFLLVQELPIAAPPETWSAAAAVVAGLRAHPCITAWQPDGDPADAARSLLAEVVDTEDHGRALLTESPFGAVPDTHWGPCGEVSRWFGAKLPLATHGSVRELLHALELQAMIEAERRRPTAPLFSLPCTLADTPEGARPEALLDARGRPRPAYYALRRSSAPFHVSADFATLAWQGESAFRAEVWLHNDGEERSLLNVVATVVDLHGRELYQENLAGEAPAGSAENVGDLHWRFPAGFEDAFLLFLEVIDEEGDVLARNAYPHSRAAGPAFAPFNAAPETGLDVRRTPGGVAVTNIGSVVAFGVEAHSETATFNDGAFHLRPGERREITVEGEAPDLLAVAWNAGPTCPPS